MPATGPALTFDPRYVDLVIQTWQKHDFQPMPPAELADATEQQAADTFRALNEKGLLEEEVSKKNITGALSLLKSLKLTKQAKVGPKNAQVAKIAATPAGQKTLHAAEAVGGIRVALVSELVKQSTALSTLLHALEQHGPLVLPMLSPIPGAPRKGPAYKTAIQQGIAKFGELPAFRDDKHMPTPKGNATPAQMLKESLTLALQKQPAGQIAGVEKIIPVAQELGLLWIDTQQINEVIAAHFVGIAAVAVDGIYIPNTPKWEEIRPRFMEELLHAHYQLADGSGFMTIEALRGALGRALHLSRPVVDAFLRQARDETDRQHASVRLHFEEDEESMYVKGRHPLFWNDYAFDFVAVTPEAEKSGAYRRDYTSVER